MKHSIALEWIGERHDREAKLWRSVAEMAIPGSGELFRVPSRRPWIAEITGFDIKYKFKRVFVDSKKDYSNSNSKGTRGINLVFIVEEGKIYQVFENLSWNRTNKYYFMYVDGYKKILSEEEVSECLIKSVS